MTRKWNIEFFARSGLILAYWFYYHKIYGYSIENYIQRMKEKQKKPKKGLKKKDRNIILLT